MSAASYAATQKSQKDDIQSQIKPGDLQKSLSYNKLIWKRVRFIQSKR